MAVAAAASNALSSVMQREANRKRSDEAFGLRLLASLVRQPAWLVGAVAMLASFLLQAGALSRGELSSVEPVLVLELPMTLILAAAVLHHRLLLRDWAGIAAMTAGLVLFVALLSPSGGDAAHVSALVSLLATVGTAAGIAALTAVAAAGPDRSRAALFGIAAGSGFGLTASLIKVAMARLSAGGVVGLFTAWQTYGFAVTGVASVVLIQAALHAGTLVAAQPGITLFDPLVSLLWGTVVLGETVTTSVPALALSAVGAAMIAGSVMVLARSSQRAVELSNR
jgi:drug/metabolite transporter (DMT)-like permease